MHVYLDKHAALTWKRRATRFYQDTYILHDDNFK